MSPVEKSRSELNIMTKRFKNTEEFKTSDLDHLTSKPRNKHKRTEFTLEQQFSSDSS